MTARSTYESSRKNAGPVCTQAQTNAAAAAQESINAASTKRLADFALVRRRLTRRETLRLLFGRDSRLTHDL